MEKQEHKDFLIAFGNQVKRLREQQKISRVQMAFEIGSDEKQLRLIENGSINTGIISVYKIATVLDVSPKDLLDF